MTKPEMSYTSADGLLAILDALKKSLEHGYSHLKEVDRLDIEDVILADDISQINCIENEDYAYLVKEIDVFTKEVKRQLCFLRDGDAFIYVLVVIVNSLREDISNKLGTFSPLYWTSSDAAVYDRGFYKAYMQRISDCQQLVKQYNAKGLKLNRSYGGGDVSLLGEEVNKFLPETIYTVTKIYFKYVAGKR